MQRFLASPPVVAIQLNQARYIGAARKQDWMTQTAPVAGRTVRLARPVPRTSTGVRHPTRSPDDFARAIQGYL